MCTVIQEGKVKSAKKDHRCGACENLREFYSEIGRHIKMTIPEYRAIITAKNNKFIIRKGQPYVWQFNTDGGDVWKFKAIEEIHKICVKYDLYPEC